MFHRDQLELEPPRDDNEQYTAGYLFGRDCKRRGFVRHSDYIDEHASEYHPAFIQGFYDAYQER